MHALIREVCLSDDNSITITKEMSHKNCAQYYTHKLNSRTSE